MKNNFSRLIAQINNPIIPNSATNIANPQPYFNRVLKAVINIFLIVGVIYYLWHAFMGAYHFINSEGDKNKFESAKTEFTQAIIGLFILFSIFAILKVIGTVFGIDSLKNNLQIVWPTI